MNADMQQQLQQQHQQVDDIVINMHHNSDATNEPELTMRQEISLILLVFFVIGAQMGISFWRKYYSKSFHEATTLGLITVPFCFAFLFRHWRFIIVSILFIIITGRLIYKATRKPVDLNTPSYVYRWFLVVHRLCYFFAMLGVSIIAFDVMNFWAGKIIEIPSWIWPNGLITLFYGAYFGILNRDLATVCAERMSNSIGFIKYERPPYNICALCGNELRPSFVYEGGPAPPRPFEKVDESDEANIQEQKKVFKLPGCSHEFHEECIRGWTIIGKKDTCPFCLEKVELKDLLQTSPWERASKPWNESMEMVRFALVWNPIILIAINLFLYYFGGFS